MGPGPPTSSSRWIDLRHDAFASVVVFLVVLPLCMGIAVAACSGDKPKELLETAEFEERQHNVAHAKQLYDDLIRLYPDSKQAESARARLAALNQAP